MKKDYFKGKVIWITGASSGLGAEFARQLNQLGAQLILSARSLDKLQSLESELAGSEIEVLPLDMRDKVAIENASQAALQKFSKVDILINNAGISQRGLVRETPDAVDLSLLETNFLGPVRHTKALLPSMLKNKFGHLVVISSVTGKLGTPLRSAYAASKHALHGFYDSLRAEEEDNGIFVTIFTPGYIYTNISNNALTAKGERQGTTDENSKNGMLPKVFVEKALRHISHQKAEVVIGGTETLGIYLKRYFPSLLRKIVKGRKP